VAEGKLPAGAESGGGLDGLVLLENAGVLALFLLDPLAPALRRLLDLDVEFIEDAQGDHEEHRGSGFRTRSRHALRYPLEVPCHVPKVARDHERDTEHEPETADGDEYGIRELIESEEHQAKGADKC